MSFYYGTAGNDAIDVRNWDYNWNGIVTLGGDDDVVVPLTGGNYYFSGGNGNDFFQGGSGSERIFGGAGNDDLRGYSGNDHFYGGIGSDKLTGDNGIDTFHFEMGESQARNGQADIITDWDVARDWIDMPIKGRSGGYSESSTHATSIQQARYEVEHNDRLSDGDYTFLYNSKTGTGYLLADLNGNYNFETGIILRGAGHASDFNWSDIM